MLRIEAVCGRCTLGAVRNIRHFARDGAVRNQFSDGRVRLVLVVPDDDDSSTEFQHQLGDCLAYSAGSPDDDEFLSAKFEVHACIPFLVGDSFTDRSSE